MYGEYGRLHVLWIWEVTCMVDMGGYMYCGYGRLHVLWIEFTIACECYLPTHTTCVSKCLQITYMDVSILRLIGLSTYGWSHAMCAGHMPCVLVTCHVCWSHAMCAGHMPCVLVTCHVCWSHAMCAGHMPSVLVTCHVCWSHGGHVCWSHAVVVL